LLLSFSESSPYLFTTTSVSYIFLLMLPLPPSSTLFPYTTLFRSESYATSATGRNHSIRDDPSRTDDGGRFMTMNDMVLISVINRDRKSTRLNSSHDQISYAVFCLKKKIKQKARHHPPRRTLTPCK